MAQAPSLQAFLATLRPEQRALYDVQRALGQETPASEVAHWEEDKREARQGQMKGAADAFAAALAPEQFQTFRDINIESANKADRASSRAVRKELIPIMLALAGGIGAVGGFTPAAASGSAGSGTLVGSAGSDALAGSAAVDAGVGAGTASAGSTAVAAPTVTGGTGLGGAGTAAAAGTGTAGLFSKLMSGAKAVADNPIVQFGSMVAPLVGGAALVAGAGGNQPAPDPTSAIAAQQEQIIQQNNAAAQLAQTQADQAQKTEQERQARIKQGEQSIADAFSSFTPDYYDAMRKDYLGVQAPELQRQYDDARERTTYSLARTGNLESSAAADAFKRLLTRSTETDQQIKQDASSRAQSAQAATETARNELLMQNKQSADPGVISAGAAARSATLRTPNPIQPISNVFTDLLSDVVRAGGTAMTLGRNGYQPFRTSSAPIGSSNGSTRNVNG